MLAASKHKQRVAWCQAMGVGVVKRGEVSGGVGARGPERDRAGTVPAGARGCTVPEQVRAWRAACEQANATVQERNRTERALAKEVRTRIRDL